jgi:hypothetical protein
VRLTIEIETDNAAFDRNSEGEVYNVMRRVSMAFHPNSGGGLTKGDTRKLMDSNGNTCGLLTIEEA